MRSEVRRYEERSRQPRSSYQLELGSKSLLGLFFIGAIVCGMFFAFGYTMGKHAIPATFTLGQNGFGPPAQAAASAQPANPPGVQAPNPTELGQAETNQTPQSLPGAPAVGGSTSTANPAAGAPATAPSGAGTAAVPSSAAGSPTAAAPPAAPAGGGSPPAASAALSGSVYQVQVFSGAQSDANSLAQDLRQRGYPVSVVPPAAGTEGLYRVEVGPYLTQAEAQAMRSRLTADGYQAVVK